MGPSYKWAAGPSKASFRGVLNGQVTASWGPCWVDVRQVRVLEAHGIEWLLIPIEGQVGGLLVRL